MAEQSAQDALYAHYGDMQLRVVDEPSDSGPGMDGRAAGAFLRGLRPVARVKETLKQAAKRAKALG